MSGEITVLLVSVGGRRFALDAGDVIEVIPVVAHRPAGTGPKWLLGLFNLRGRLVPLVDLSTLVDGSSTDVRLGSRIVVLRLEDEFFGGDLFRSNRSGGESSEGSSRPIGLLVPEVSGLARRDFTAEGVHEGFTFAGAPHLGPTLVDDDGMLQLLRCRRLLEGDAVLRELPARVDP